MHATSVMKLLSCLALCAACSLPRAGPLQSKVLRLAFSVAESGFDPARIDDSYSHSVTVHIFESLYAYDYLAVPAKVRPLTAAAMPEHSADFRVWTIKLQPGIFFTDDRVLQGRKRELVAHDYVSVVSQRPS